MSLDISDCSATHWCTDLLVGAVRMPLRACRPYCQSRDFAACINYALINFEITAARLHGANRRDETLNISGVGDDNLKVYSLTRKARIQKPNANNTLFAPDFSINGSADVTVGLLSDVHVLSVAKLVSAPYA